MKYLIFHTKTEYEQETIEEHINYLKKWGGTPNFWDSYNDLMEAMEQAKYFHEMENCKVVIYDEETENIVYTFNPNI